MPHHMHLIHPEHPLSGPQIPRSGKSTIRPSGGLLSERRLAYFLSGAPRLNLLVQLVIERSTFEEDTRWTRAGLLMYAAVPPDKKEEVDDEIKSENDSAWFNAGFQVFGRILTNSSALVLGWVIHVLAA
jgi:hypothetical protein